MAAPPHGGCDKVPSMDRGTLRELLEAVRAGDVDADEAVDRLSAPAFVETEHARVDTHRALRHGLPEVIYAPGKTPEQILEVMEVLRREGQDVLVTRLDAEPAAIVTSRVSAEYDPMARVLWAGRAEVPQEGKGAIAIACAGTSDLPVAREAELVARRFGNKVELLFDVGVAGIHRLLGSSELLRAARVVIVVAGMEGALPSVVGGLVDKPVIAVPTSVGYGASFGGVSALLGMLNSCASNVTVVNIDNGFGAAYVATLINRL